MLTVKKYYKKQFFKSPKLSFPQNMAFYSGKELFRFYSASDATTSVQMMTDCLKDFNAFKKIMLDEEVINKNTSLNWSRFQKKKT